MVKPGYKQTEIGVLPEDWDVVSLLDEADLLNGLTYTPSNVRDYGLLVMRSSNVQNGRFAFDDNVYVNCEVEDSKLIKKGDILICVRNGSAALIGKCAKADRDYNATFGAFMAVLRGANNDYIYQLLQQGAIQRHIAKNSDSTINQITNGDFKQIVVPFPKSQAERATISAVLSDIDDLIANLKKLIAKKKAIKQGVMQELLSGKRRLPGFDSEWKTVQIGTFTSVFSGGTPSTANPLYWGGNIPWMSSGELNMKIVREVRGRITATGMENSSTRMIPAFCVLIGLAGQGKTRGTAAFNMFPLCTNQSIAAIFPNESQFDSKFLYFYMDTQYTELRELSAGGGGRGGLTKKLIEDFYVTIPSDIKEQASIAEILTDIDDEIENLEKELYKTMAIKQGMMSELLTGRIRLIDKEDA